MQSASNHWKLSGEECILSFSNGAIQSALQYFTIVLIFAGLSLDVSQERKRNRKHRIVLAAQKVNYSRTRKLFEFTSRKKGTI